MTVTAALAGFAHATRYEALPPAVVALARNSLVDLLMVARAGAARPHVLATLRLLRADGTGAGRVWSGGGRLPLRSAAFFNALCAAALDYDSVVGSVHADLVVWPALLAITGARPTDGRALIAGYAIGAEIAARLGVAATGASRGWSPTAIFGPFGAAAASARLLGGSADQIARALGLALGQAAGTQQSHVEQVLAKSLQPALTARAGLFAAQLALAGITAPAEPIEGRLALGAVYQSLDHGRLLVGLGENWLILDTAFKKYPVCACSHPLIEACVDLVVAHDLAAGDIAGIEVVVTPTIARLVGGDFAPTGDPQVSAQFSLRYGLACVVLHRRLGIDELHVDRVLDPAAAALAGRVAIAVDETRPGAYGPSDLRIVLRDGRVLDAIATRLPGGRDRPLTATERADKFRDCARAPGPDQADIEAWTGRLPDLADVDAAWPGWARDQSVEG